MADTEALEKRARHNKLLHRYGYRWAANRRIICPIDGRLMSYEAACQVVDRWEQYSPCATPEEYLSKIQEMEREGKQYLEEEGMLLN